MARIFVTRKLPEMMMITIMMMQLLFIVTTMIVFVDGFTASSTRRLVCSNTDTTTSLDVFGRRGGGDGNKRASSSSSPLLEEGLEAYPFGFFEDNKNAMVSRKQATATFNELARLYGDEEAVAMVKLQPRSLVFDSSNFGPCLDAWTEQFGLEAAQGMVNRNPGLLGVRASSAQEPAEAAMFFSYIIGVTRPLPKILGVGLLLSIATAGLH